MTGINLTQGPLLPKMMAFAIPYLLACFLQTFYGISVCIIFGLLATLIVHFCAEWVISLFVSHEPEVVRLGGEYFRTYVIDCIFAGIHFCFSGYFSAYGKSIYSFLHNMISIVTVRVPGTYLAILLFPETLSPMGLAAPIGPLLSAIICMGLYHWKFKRSADRRSDERAGDIFSQRAAFPSRSRVALSPPRKKSTDICRCFLLAIS